MNAILKTINLADAQATQALGARLANTLKPGDILALRGDLGAGKTTLARGFINKFMGDINVPSPTYTLLQTYNSPQFDIWHFDLYRLEDEADIWELDIEKALEDGVCLIEWPERIENLLSGNELCVNIRFLNQGRCVNISGNHMWKDRLNDV
ncbi:MAG: tRNA (adenosine(37)-N6)-threonylcarbamoyltransferase complex ATPase subunit type 1 TsaE [Robiginitomaculum sp.]